MKIDSFDRSNLRLLGTEIDDALKAVADKFGITVSRKPGRFGTSDFTCKVEFATVGTDGTALTKERSAFEAFASFNGLQKEMLDGDVMFRGELYKITGMSTSNRAKANVNVKRVRDNRGFRMSPSMILAGYQKKV